MAKALSEYHEEMQQNIDQATSDLRETLEQIEIQNVELDMAKKRAQEAARVKSEFLANMSHELRTPLNGVIGFTRQLLKTSLTPSQTDYMQTIEKSARNLLGIINDILDFSKLEAGKLQLEHIPFSLRDTLNETMHLLGPSAHDKQLELSLQVDAEVPDYLTGDPMRLQQVLTNLTGNAIKFTEHGNVDVRIEQIGSASGSKVRLNVLIRDTGIGISEEQQRQLFQAFNQADSSISRRYGGTGLGLVITQKLVQQMGGQIRFESELGKGSVFSFSLDLEVSPAPDRQAAAGSHPGQAGLAAGAGSLQPLGPLRPAGGVAAGGAIPRQRRPLARNEQPGHGDHRQRYPAQSAAGGGTPRRAGSPAEHHSAAKQPRAFALRGHAGPRCPALPLQTHQPSQAAARPALSRGGAQRCCRPLPRSVQEIKVLAVDDNAANLKLIAAMLKEMVSQVVVCKNGKEAVRLAQSQPFDIIFMDIQMPIMDGISATQAIRSQSLNTETPIVAVTAHAIPGERERLIRQGMDDYLAKPIDEAMLAKLITDFAHRRHQNHASQQIDWALAVRQAAGKLDLARRC